MAKMLTFPRERTARPEQPARPEAAVFYSPAEAARLARIPRQRLASWRREGIVFPTVTIEDFDGRESTGYTFEALVYLRLLRLLRDHNIPLFEAVKAVKHLRDRFGSPGQAWEAARIFVQGRDVFVGGKDEWEATAANRGGQKAATVLLGDEFAQLRDRADALLVPRQFQPFVRLDPVVRSGLPVINGTTLPTAVVHAMHQRGETLRAIQAAYPHLTRAQIKGALNYERFLDVEAA